MFRAFVLLSTLLTTSTAFAGDLLPIVFEDSNIIMDGKAHSCDLYYVLVGDKGSLDKGDLVQVTQMHNDRKHYGVAKARYTLSAKDQLTIHWAANQGEKFGKREVGELKALRTGSRRYRYNIKFHDDKSQAGESLKVRIVDYSQLPQYVRNAVQPTILAHMSPQQRRLHYAMIAEQIRTSEKIISDLLR